MLCMLKKTRVGDGKEVKEMIQSVHDYNVLNKSEKMIPGRTRIEGQRVGVGVMDAYNRKI